MKKVLWILTAFTLLLVSCLDKGEDTPAVEEPVVTEPQEERIPCFSIFPGGLSVRATADPDGERVFTVGLRETVYWTGESQRVGNYTWIEVVSEDEEMRGWCYEIYLPAQALAAIMTDRMLKYDEPELGSVSDERIEKYQFAAVTATEGQFYEIRWVTEDRKYHAGYIKQDNISLGDQAMEDIQVLNLVEKASDPAMDLEVANEILSDAMTFRNSNFYQEAVDLYNRLNSSISHTSTPTTLMAPASRNLNADGVNVRSTPSQDGNIIATLNAGAVGEVIEVSSFTESIGSFGENYWYKINFQGESTGIEGWVYGYFTIESMP